MKEPGTVVVSVDANDPDDAIVRRAVQVVAGGEMIAFPTETFYGLGADPWNEAALDALFAAKGRPSRAPVLLLLASENQALEVAAVRPPGFERLARTFWPGPLTLVLPARPDLPERLTAGSGGIGIRVSASPLARALPRSFGRPITGTSANKSGSNPGRTAEDVKNAMGEGYADVALLLDGGETPGTNPSTVVDLTGEAPKLVREGMIPFARVLEALR